MKKIVLSLAGVLAATAFAPEASAVPAFARQTGMACQACHFQHFPALNAFGRAFKASGYTMMGAQGKVEGEHLSIPNTLNMNILVTAGLDHIANLSTAANPSNTQVLVPNGGGELSLFVGGRVSENIGFLSELGFTNSGAAGPGVTAKLPMMWDVGGVKAGLVLVTNNAPAYSLELLNTGAVSTHRLMGNTGFGGNHINVTSAAQYVGFGAIKGHGASAVVTGESGFVNIGKYGLAAASLQGATAVSNQLNSTYLRGAYIFNVGGWDSAVGIQNISGRDSNNVAGVVSKDTKLTAIDGQMQGEMGGMPVGLYASYGRQPASAVNGSLYSGANLLTQDRKSFNIAGELGVIPHVATLQLAFRRGNTGNTAAGVAAGISDRDNAIMIGGTYELAQNVELSLTHTANSGGAYTATGTLGSGTVPAGAVVGKTQTTLLIEALF